MVFAIDLWEPETADARASGLPPPRMPSSWRFRDTLYGKRKPLGSQASMASPREEVAKRGKRGHCLVIAYLTPCISIICSMLHMFLRFLTGAGDQNDNDLHQPN